MSFLQHASAKIIANRHLNKQVDSPTLGRYENVMHTLAETLRLLLVEEECEASNDGSEYLTRSLAMDFAYSVVSSSSFGCRGCYKYSVDSTHDKDDLSIGNVTSEMQSKGDCKCCKVALLIPGEPSKEKKHRRKEGKLNCHRFSRNAKFPMCFLRKSVDGDKGWNPTLLGQIKIKYVTTLTEVIKFLAYATSLPDHLQPLDGIFLIGMGQILPRQNINMELTHLRKLCWCCQLYLRL